MRPSHFSWLREQIRFFSLALLLLLPVNICLQHQQQQMFATAFAAVEDNNNNKNNNNWKTKAHTSDIFPGLNEFSTHTVIRPQVQHGGHKRSIQSTLDAEDGLHAPHITLSYTHQGQRVQIDLKRNDRLLPATHFLRYQNKTSPTDPAARREYSHVVRNNFAKTELDLCHYQGQIRGNPQSTVALSTCNGGLTGFVFDGNDTYFLQPFGTGSGRLLDEHYLLRHADMLETNATCGYNSVNDAYDVHSHVDEVPHVAVPQHLDGSELKRMLRRKRSSDEGNVIRGPYNANKHSSYVELVIVVDNKVYKHFGSSAKRVHQHCKDLANIVNALYVPLNIFVALVGVVIWSESNEIEFSSDGDVTLRSFLNYRSKTLVLEHPNDNAQLLTKEQFSGGVVGKALKGPICTYEYSGGVSMQHSQLLPVVATTMAHEMGHNFGMEHDTSDCKCQDEKCIMAASSTAVVPVHWSSCSIDQLNIAFSRGMNYCLRNKPTKLFDSPVCGNGFVEPGEQCDCGLPNYCENTCCDPYKCMLHANASCATGECCDLTTCRPKMASIVCREKESECDLPEYCTGESEYCPADVYKRDTEECDDGKAYCFQGTCRSHANQCRILWGPTGDNSEHCYYKNTEGIRLGNCGYNRLNKTYVRCAHQDIKCGLLHCIHLNERLEFGMESAAELSHSYVNHGGKIVACRTALVDLGLQSTDPGLTPNGAKCDTDHMCVNQKCLSLESVRKQGFGANCPQNCNGNGVCNSRGNCHCYIGFGGDACNLPGHGGSRDSGPETDPNANLAFERFLYIFFFAVIPCMAAFCFFMYYCRYHKFFTNGKFAENILKTASGTKQPPARGQHHNGVGGGHGAAAGAGLPKSTPSSTDDMNSALLKSPSDGHEQGATLSNGLYGKFKGFTLRPLNATATPTNNLNGPNVAFVQPTMQDAHTGVPQRAAPPPPLVLKTEHEMNKLNGSVTLSRKAPVVPGSAAPALPPPNPGSSARPIISMPVLENSTLTLKKSTSDSIEGGATTASVGTLKPAPPPPVPLHADPKLNIKRDGTIRRIASFLKKEDKPPAKEKTYIDREKLRNLEISAPMPVPAQAESSNSDSETTPREEETKNLVKRAQSMRSPTKKTNVQSFGSMRSPPGTARPKSIVTQTSTTRPKSPPPRPPPVLKKTNSTTSSGYQMPVATAKSTMENTYDDCEFVELPLKRVDEVVVSKASPDSNDDIYSVIDEIPPAAQTLKRSDLVSITSNGSDLGLLGEIVNEIEKRNGDSIYTAKTVNTPMAAPATQPKEQQPKSPQRPAPTKPPLNTTDSKKSTATKTPVAAATAPTATTPTVTATTTATPTYLRPAPINTPVARVAPTRSDISPSRAFSSFKPPPAGVASANLTAAATATATVTAAAAARSASTAATTTRPKSYTRTQNRTLPSGNGSSGGAPSATIQKPKPLSAKPSFNNQKRTPGAATAATTSTNKTLGSAVGAVATPRVTPTPPTVKAANIASLTQRFERK